MKGKKAIQSKFPTARIKKIMQEDEEIGKVAAGAPIVISRALELFLRDIILSSAHIALEQNTKKIQPHHIKRLAGRDRTYDFLDDVLAKWGDVTGGAVSGGATSAGGAGAGGGSGKTAAKPAAASKSTSTLKGKSKAKPSSEVEESDSEQEMDGSGSGDGGAGPGSEEE